MKTVLITGADGFVGKNLISTLKELESLEILKYDIKNTLDELKDFTMRADFVFHLAGVNRPEDINEFEIGNKGFTEQLLDFLKENDKKTPILMTSSTQAELDNPYGQSKKSAENAVFDFGKETNSKVFVYRLPNVFGKWCRPNYNSVVATWCHNITRELPIQINNPDAELNLVYIDDIIIEFINALNGTECRKTDDFCFVSRTFDVTLKQLADTLYAFKESRKTLILPSLEGDFERFLYATYLSYLPEHDFGYNLEMKHDNRGWLAEFIKSKGFGQIFVSRTKPGITWSWRKSGPMSGRHLAI